MKKYLRIGLAVFISICFLTQLFQPASTGLAQTPSPTPSPSPTAALPQGGPGNYRLKEWSIEDAQAVLDALKVKSDRQSVEGNNGSSLYGSTDFIDSQITLLREIKLRFPVEFKQKKITQELYERGLMLGLGVDLHLRPIERVRIDLEKVFNNTDGKPADLTAWLDENMPGTTIEDKGDVENLFGDRKTARLLQVNYIYYWFFIGKETDNQGKVHLYAVQKDWSFLWNDDLIIATKDLNGNGRPEVAIQHHTSGSGFAPSCGQYMDVYEWDGQHFISLGENLGLIRVSPFVVECAGWDFIPQPDGSMLLASQKIIGSTQQSTLFAWDGRRFVWAGEEIRQYENTYQSMVAVDWAYEAGPHNGQAFTILQNAIETWPDLIKWYWGPAAQDFFRYKLGLWYAFLGDRQNALKSLMNVRDHPTNPKYQTASRMADTFLRGYQSKGAYAGCASVIDTFLPQLQRYTYPVGSGEYSDIDFDKAQEAWGFKDPGWFSSSDAFWPDSGRNDEATVCSLAEAFKSDAEQVEIQNQNQLINWLNQRAIPWTGLQSADLDEDGVKDWLVLVSAGYSSDERDLWALLHHGANLQPIRIRTLYGTDGSGSAYRFFQPAGRTEHFHAYLFGGGITIFRLVPGLEKGSMGVELPVVSRILDDQGQTAVTWMIDVRGKAPEEELTLLNRYSPNSRLIWDEIEGVFKEINDRPNQSEQIELIEGKLIIDGDAEQARLQIQKMLRGPIYESIPSPWEESKFAPRLRPYLTYLLGLTYELTGDSARAVQTYYQLWKDYPQNPYALIAREKLELRH